MGHVPHLLQVVRNKGEGHHPVSHSRTLHLPTGSALLCCSGEGPSPLSASVSEGQEGPVVPSVAASKGCNQLSTARSSQTSVVSGVMDINRVHRCVRAMIPDLGPSSSPDPDFTSTLDIIQVTHITQILACFFLQICCWPPDMNHSVSIP